MAEAAPLDGDYDYIIVGAGSAGCLLANRLSADPSTRVLVLEAGRSDSWWDVYVHMPAALSFPIGNPRYDWGYESEPEPGTAAFGTDAGVLAADHGLPGVVLGPGSIAQAHTSREFVPLREVEQMTDVLVALFESVD